MTSSQEEALGADIEATTRAVRGVTGLFRTGSAVSKIVDVGAHALGIRDGAAPLVHVEQSPHGTGVRVAIGVDGSVAAVAVVRHVCAAVEARLVELGAIPTEIHITIVHIDETNTRGKTKDGRYSCGDRLESVQDDQERPRNRYQRSG